MDSKRIGVSLSPMPSSFPCINCSSFVLSSSSSRPSFHSLVHSITPSRQPSPQVCRAQQAYAGKFYKDHDEVIGLVSQSAEWVDAAADGYDDVREGFDGTALRR